MSEVENVKQTFRDSLRVSKETNGVNITVLPEYLENDSDPSYFSYAFAYTITIENYRKDTIKLLSRHWFVKSGGTLYLEVEGEGVVGDQPVLNPEQWYQYTSGTLIKDPVGQMYGYYEFELQNSEKIIVDIPCFDLICPLIVQ